MTEDVMPEYGKFYKRVKTGEVFGRLTVMSHQGGQFWLCRCICGADKLARKTDLERAKVRSCGCYNIERIISRSTKHGLAARGEQHPLYGLWNSMLNRCYNPGNKDYGLYGGRGVRVCDRWHDFKNFLEDMGERPSKRHSLDRYPNKNGNYEPRNVRWATDLQQVRNRRNTVCINGAPLYVVAETIQVNPRTLNRRLQNGMTGEQLLFTGLHKTGPKPSKAKK